MGGRRRVHHGGIQVHRRQGNAVGSVGSLHVVLTHEEDMDLPRHGVVHHRLLEDRHRGMHHPLQPKIDPRAGGEAGDQDCQKNDLRLHRIPSYSCSPQRPRPAM